MRAMSVWDLFIKPTELNLKKTGTIYPSPLIFGKPYANRPTSTSRRKDREV